ncbi:uncharacterized protein V6R79_013321 [Siganus canaliculatus]
MPSSQSRSRLRDQDHILDRPEFQSLSQAPRSGRRDPAGRWSSDGGAADCGVKDAPRWPEQDCMQLHPSFGGIAVSSLLAIDISLSRRLGALSGVRGPGAPLRTLVTLLSLSGHVLLWTCGSLLCLWSSSSSAGQEVAVNLLLALVLDLMTVAGVQKLVQRRPPCDLPVGFWDYVAMDTTSFPAAHASRAALVSRFLLTHLLLAVPLRILLYLWAVLVGVAQVLLGKHHLSDVGCGFALGLLHFSLVESVWLDSAACQTLVSMATLSWAPLV